MKHHILNCILHLKIIKTTLLALKLLSCTSYQVIVKSQSKMNFTEATDISKLSLQKVEAALRSNPKGEEIFKEYNKMKMLSDSTRRQMVNILIADMTESYG